jgi:hypothetical protein
MTTENASGLSVSGPVKSSRPYVVRKGEFNDWSIDKMLEEIARLNQAISSAKKATSGTPLDVRSLKDLVSRRVRAYRWLNANGYSPREMRKSNKNETTTPASS